MAKQHKMVWFEKHNFKKKRFKELYGRRPNKEERKLLRKDMIDLKITVAPNIDVVPINEKISVKLSGGKVQGGV